MLRKELAKYLLNVELGRLLMNVLRLHANAVDDNASKQNYAEVKAVYNQKTNEHVVKFFDTMRKSSDKLVFPDIEESRKEHVEALIPQQVTHHAPFPKLKDIHPYNEVGAGLASIYQTILTDPDPGSPFFDLLIADGYSVLLDANLQKYALSCAANDNDEIRAYAGTLLRKQKSNKVIMAKLHARQPGGQNQYYT